MLYVAYGGPGTGSGYGAGTINLNTHNQVAASGNGGNPGNIMIISGATSVPTGQSGITLSTVQPTSLSNVLREGVLTLAQAIPQGQVTIKDGSIISGAIIPGALQNISIGSSTSPLFAFEVIAGQTRFLTAGDVYFSSNIMLALGPSTFGTNFNVKTVGPIYVAGDIVALNPHSSITLTSTTDPFSGIGNQYYPTSGILRVGNAHLIANSVNLVGAEPAPEPVNEANENWNLAWVNQPITDFDGGQGIINPQAIPPILSLDLTDQSLVSLVLFYQHQFPANFGGNLVVTNGVATGGNLILNPSDLGSNLSAENVPSGVTVTLKDFSASNPLNINLSAASHSQSVIVNGTQQFISSSGNSQGVINISSTAGAPALQIGGQLTSDGSLAVLAGGDISVTGAVSAGSGNLSLATTAASNGNIVLGGTLSSTAATTITAGGNGNVSLTAGNLSGAAISLSSLTGNVTLLNNISTAGSFAISTAGTIALNGVQANSINILSTAGSVNVSGNLDASGVGADGSGGSVSVIGSALNFNGASQSVSANGTNNGNGGTIALSGTTIGIAGNAPLSVSANGSGTGAGGNVALSATDSSQGNLAIANAPGAITISATGGSANSSAGNGGTVSVLAGNNLSVDTSAISAGALGTNGSGANLSFSAGTAGAGSLSISGGSLNADGVGKVTEAKLLSLLIQAQPYL